MEKKQTRMEVLKIRRENRLKGILVTVPFKESHREREGGRDLRRTTGQLRRVG